MSKSILAAIKKIQSSVLAASIAAAAGAAAFLAQSLVYMFRLPSTLDEGNYLYKGYLFATGALWPYQDFGVWTNKMPFAFLIPGWAQSIFGPGLRSGRYFAIFLALLMLLGLWIVARRLGGKWWAAGAVLAIGLNPGMIRMLDQALSEGVVVCLLMWVLVFILQEKCKLWQLMVGSFLAALIFLTRENMLPVPFFAFLFIWWQHGRRQALIAGGIMALVVIGVHAIFWPNILILWAAQIPASFTPFLDAFRGYLGSTSIWRPRLSFISRLHSFWEAWRYHFVPMAAMLIAIVLWPRRDRWKSSFQFRTALILTAMMLVLTLLHIWAALMSNYCTYCFPLYMTFFSPLGLLVAAAVFPSISAKTPLWRDLPAALLVLILGAGVGFGAHQDLFGTLLTLPVPRIRNMQFQEGFTELWRLLANKFTIGYDDLKQIVPASFGLAAGVLILLAALLVVLLVNKKQNRLYSVGALALLICFVTGSLLTPSFIFGNATEADCGGDVIASYEAAAPILRENVPPGSTVFWEGGLAPIPLLSLPGVKVFGPMLNDGYAFKIGGDSDRMYQFGYWNVDLQMKWLHSADILLIEDRGYKKGYNEIISPDEFEQIGQTPPILTCRELSSIRIFRRKP